MIYKKHRILLQDNNFKLTPRLIFRIRLLGEAFHCGTEHELTVEVGKMSMRSLVDLSNYDFG